MELIEKNVASTQVKTCNSGQDRLSEIVSAVNQRRQLFYRLALRYLGNAADAEDAVQDALLLAIKKLDHFRGDAQISSWLTRIVINVSLMKLRRRSRDPQVSIDALTWGQDNQTSLQIFVDCRPDPEEIVRRGEYSERLRQVVLCLSPVLRRTYQLRDEGELSIRETARILGVPEGTVKTREVRTRAKLKQLMQRPR